MPLDIQTLLYSSGLVVITAGISFVITTILRREDAASRLWSIGFIAGMLATISYAVWGYSPDLWWIVAIGNASLCLALGAMWSGCRSYNSRSSLFWAALGVSAYVGFAVVARGPGGGSWAGAAEMFLGIVVFSTLASAETMRGRLRHSVNARILMVVFAGVAIYYLIRTCVFVVVGETSDAFLSGFGTATTTLINIVFITLTSVSLSVLQVEGSSSRRGRVTAGPATTSFVVESRQFAQQATEWLRRAEINGEQLAMLVLDVENLDHMNIAMGAEFGDRAILTVGRLASDNVPTTSIVGRFSTRRFAVLTVPPAYGEVRSLAEHVHTAIAETPIDPTEGIRAIATFGVATTASAGYGFRALERSAEGALRSARAEGPGSIHVANPAASIDNG